MRNVGSRFYFQISIEIARPDLPEDETPSDILALAVQLASPIEKLIDNYVAYGLGSLSEQAATVAASALVNISLAYSKIGDFDRAAGVRMTIERLSKRLRDTEHTREIRIKAMHNALSGQMIEPTLAHAFQTVADARRLVAKGVSAGGAVSYLSMTESILSTVLVRSDKAAFRRQFRLFLDTIPSLPDTPGTRTWLIRVLDKAMSILWRSGQTKELTWTADSLAASAKKHCRHLPSQLGWISVAPLLLQSAKRGDADRQLDEAIRLAREHPEVTEISDKLLDCAIFYWSRFGEMRDQHLGGVCDIVVTARDPKESWPSKIQA